MCRAQDRFLECNIEALLDLREDAAIEVSTVDPPEQAVDAAAAEAARLAEDELGSEASTVAKNAFGEFPSLFNLSTELVGLEEQRRRLDVAERERLLLVQRYLAEWGVRAVF